MASPSETSLIIINSAPLDHATQQHAAGAAANVAAAAAVFAQYRRMHPVNTLRRQAADLAAFASYLQAVGVPADGERLSSEASAWAGVTWGLVAGFIEWQLNEGYALGTVGVRLATVKRYVTLATQAGVIAADELHLIKTVNSYSVRAGKEVDKERDVTRRSTKKAIAPRLSAEQIAALKQQPDTPVGRRDLLLVCLLLDHGLRVGEVVGLDVTALNVKRAELTFYRPKVDKIQTHRLTSDTLQVAVAYLANDAPALGQLVRGSRNGVLCGTMKERSMNDRVRQLGKLAGIPNLSPHDLRHAWATRAAKGKTDILRLQDAGGWSSLEMPARYVEAAKVANDGVRLEDE